MKIKEINEGLGDVAAAIGSGLYRATGGFMGSKQAAIERNFISSFKNQLARSARNGGPAFDLEDYLLAYAEQYGWPLSDKEKQFLTQYATDATNSKYSSSSLTQIAKLMYSLADKYRKIQGGGTYTRGGTNTGTNTKGTNTKGTNTKSTTTNTSGTNPTPPGGSTPATKTSIHPGTFTVPAGGAPMPTPGAGTPAQIGQTKQSQTSTSPSTASQPAAAPAAPASKGPTPSVKGSTGQRILNALNRVYREPNGKSDLEKIMRDAAYLLSRLDKARYNATIRDLSTGGAFAAGVKGSATTPQDVTGVRPTPKTTPEPTATVPKDLNQAMPGYSKAADDLEQKMTGSPMPPGPRAYRPGTRKSGVTDVTPKRK